MRATSTRSDELVAIDLFCGAGGFTEGFKQAGYSVPFALDWDADACETHQINHRGTDVEHGSITSLTPTQMARRIGAPVDVVIGGPSCQGFSTARKTRWHDPDSDRNQLWTHMFAVVAKLRPQAFVIENVPGMVMWKSGNFGASILAEFRSLGYTVSEPKILLAADYGVPQRRRRLFIVGLLGDRHFEFPEPTHMGGWRRDAMALWEQRREEAGLYRHLSCWEAMFDLPLLEGTGGRPRSEYLDVRPSAFVTRMRSGSSLLRDHETQVLGKDHLDLVSHVPIGGTWRDIPPHLLPDRFRGMRRTDSSNLLGRLDPALPSYTITTQFTNVTVGCNTHPFEDRPLTIREGARLQSFPDRYRFVGSLASRARQIGNAVPPVLARVLAAAIAEQIDTGTVKVTRPRAIKPAAVIPGPPTTPAVRARMKAQRKKDTKPETLLRAALDELGAPPYETNVRPLEGLNRSADVVFAKHRVAVFADGCFWHGCPVHSRDTKSNTKWWREKIDLNIKRDADTTRQLEAAGWVVIRVWEHEYPEVAAQGIMAVIAERPEHATAATA